jgi:hypothetical protein
MTPSAAAGSPPRDDSVTIRACPACGQAFTPSGRRRWCSTACKQAAWRRRHPTAAPVPPLSPPGGKQPMTVYECGTCGNRALGTQRCDDCGTFMRAVGIGGLCPNCEEPVTTRELTTSQ